MASSFSLETTSTRSRGTAPVPASGGASVVDTGGGVVAGVGIIAIARSFKPDTSDL
jgi:hypothetical protein